MIECTVYMFNVFLHPVNDSVIWMHLFPTRTWIFFLKSQVVVLILSVKSSVCFFQPQLRDFSSAVQKRTNGSAVCESQMCFHISHSSLAKGMKLVTSTGHAGNQPVTQAETGDNLINPVTKLCS